MDNLPKPEPDALATMASNHAQDQLVLAQLQQLAAAQAQQHHETSILNQLNQTAGMDQMHASISQQYVNLGGGHEAHPQSSTPMSTTELLRQIAPMSGPIAQHHLQQPRLQHGQPHPPQPQHPEPHPVLPQQQQPAIEPDPAWTPRQTLQDLVSNIPPNQLPFLNVSDLSSQISHGLGSSGHMIADLQAAAAAYAAGDAASQAALLNAAAREFGMPLNSAAIPPPDQVGSAMHIPQPEQPNSMQHPPSTGGPAQQGTETRSSIETAFPLPSDMSNLQAPPPQSSPRPHDQTGSPPSAAQAGIDPGAVVLAAKILTESDMKHSRAILPRIAVENNLPFLLGFRTYGLYMSDAQGTQWEFTIKSWANGRADRAQTERRKDRRVYVVEHMASYLAKHQLKVGDIIGIVAVAGHLEIHCQTQDLKAWIERPTYGAPNLVAPPAAVAGKCSVLEEIQEGDTAHRQCSRSARCTKSDGHTGFCVGAQHGPRPKSSNAKLKLTTWPSPLVEALPEDLNNPACFQSLNPRHMPPHGVLLAFRLLPEDLTSDLAYLPPRTVLKVPLACARQQGLRLTVMCGTEEFELYVKVLEGQQASGDAGKAQMQPQWAIGLLPAALAAIGCSAGDEVFIEKDAHTFSLLRIPENQLPSSPAQTSAPLMPFGISFGDLLCQRTQACMKAVNHTGFCSGHRGFKRKGMDDEMEEGAAPPRKRLTAPRRATDAKRKPAKSRTSAEEEKWMPHAGSVDATAWHQEVRHDSSSHAVSLAVPPAPGAVNRQEVTAADVLVALSSGHNNQTNDADKISHGVDPMPDHATAIPCPTSDAPMPKGSLEEQVLAMHEDHGPEPSGDGEEDSAYLELLMQNAMTNLRRHDGGAPRMGDGNL